MTDLGVRLPDGFTLVSFAERPDLVNASYEFNQAVWPRYMLEDSTADEHWDLLHEVFTEYQDYPVEIAPALHQLAAQVDRFTPSPERLD